MKKVVKTRAFKDRLKGHKDGVISLFSPEGPTSGWLYSASKDGCIRTWNLVDRLITIKHLLSRDPNQRNQDFKLDNFDYQFDQNKEQDEQQEEPYKQEVKDTNKKCAYDQFSAALFSLDFIFGGYDDGIIFSWNMGNGEIANKFEGHSDKVTQLVFLDKTLISSSLDGTIRTWNIDNAQNTFVYKLAGPVNFIQIIGKQIFAIANKNTLYELDSNTHKLGKCIKFSDASITSFLIVENILTYGTINNTLEQYDLTQLIQEAEGEEKPKEDVKPIIQIEGLKGWVLCMKLLDNYLYTGGDDRKIKVWDFKNKMKLIEEFQGHDDGIISLEFAGNCMLYSGSYDHSIRSWDLKEMQNRIRERKIMSGEDLWSTKYNAFYDKLYGKKKKKTKKGKK